MSELAIITLRNSVPGAQALAEAVVHNPSIQALNQTVWAFSLVEISHLLFLAILGGATLVLALRALGVSLAGVALGEVETMTRPWLAAGIIGGALSGLFMSIATALTLVANGAFFIKILSLFAAILFAVALSARLRGRWRPFHGGLAAFGLGILLYSLWLFASTTGVDTGAILIGAISLVFGVLVAFARRATAGAEGAAARADTLGQVLAAGTVVAWLTVTVAGRWIGFS